MHQPSPEETKLHTGVCTTDVSSVYHVTGGGGGFHVIGAGQFTVFSMTAN